MFSKEFMKFLINYQINEPVKKEETKKTKETKYYPKKLATVLVTCSK